MGVLVVNAGSSSIKIAVFDEDVAEVASGRVTEIGGAARVEVGDLRGAFHNHTTASDGRNTLAEMVAAGHLPRGSAPRPARSRGPPGGAQPLRPDGRAPRPPAWPGPAR